MRSWTRADVDADGQAAALASIQGRRVDIIHDTSGVWVSSTWAADVMSTVFPELERARLIREGAASYRLRIVLGQAHHQAPDRAADLRTWLGSEAQVSVEFVRAIPRSREPQVPASRL